MSAAVQTKAPLRPSLALSRLPLAVLQRTLALPAGLRSVPLGHRDGVTDGARERACEGDQEKEEVGRGILQRKAARSSTVALVPPIVHAVLGSSGQPLDAATRAFMEPRFNLEFSRVRVHADAQGAESARAVDARAYTVGEHIVFGPGQFAPHTTVGRYLLAHELAHVAQQGGRGTAHTTGMTLSRPGEPAELEADRLAGQVLSGGAVRPISLSSGVPQVQRQQASQGTAPTAVPGAFANEDPALHQRRLDVLGAARNAIQRLSTALSNGYLWSFEIATSTGIDIGLPINPQPVSETSAHRTARLRQLLGDLVSMVGELESAPIPPAWLAPVASFPRRGARMGVNLQISGSTQAWQDAQMFYAQRSVGRGMDPDDVFSNGFYIETDPVPVRQTARQPMGSGVALGLYIVVPDPDREPLVYHRLNQYEPWSGPGVIMEVWHDDLGYYYPYHGQKHYLPGRPT
jgi:hypothetical protein